MKKRGQVSVEFIITVGFALLIIIPLTVILYGHMTKSNEEINNNQLGLIANKITDTANSVFYLGQPTTHTLDIYLPPTVTNITFIEREIIIETSTGQPVTRMANVNLTGYISPRSGRKTIRVSALNKIVNVSEDVS